MSYENNNIKFWKTLEYEPICDPEFDKLIYSVKFNSPFESSFSLKSFLDPEKLYRSALGKTIASFRSRTRMQNALDVIESGVSIGWARWDDCIMTRIWQFLGVPQGHQNSMSHGDQNQEGPSVATHWDETLGLYYRWKNLSFPLKTDPHSSWLVPTEVLDDFRFALKEALDGKS